MLCWHWSPEIEGISRMKPESKPDIRLRPLGLPSSIQVRTDREGYPVEVHLPGQRGTGSPRRGGSRHRIETVASIYEIWRIDDEWWRQPISRLYHQVVLESGKMMTLYRDLIDGSWYAQ